MDGKLFYFLNLLSSRQVIKRGEIPLGRSKREELNCNIMDFGQGNITLVVKSVLLLNVLNLLLAGLLACGSNPQSSTMWRVPATTFVPVKPTNYDPSAAQNITESHLKALSSLKSS